MLYQDRLMTKTRNTTQKEEGGFTQPYTSMSYTPEASAKGSTVHHGSGAMRKPPFKKETPLFAPFPDRTYTTTRSFTKTASGRVHGQLNRQKICGVCVFCRQAAPGDRCEKRTFCAIYIEKRSFYQDRLGTNIGKTPKKDVFLRYGIRNLCQLV
jgi:hypothetical protein